MVPVIEQKKIPETRFPNFKNDWCEIRLEKYGELLPGLTYSPLNIRNEGLLVLRSSNIQNKEIDLEDTVFVNLKVSEEKLSLVGDILICVRNGSTRLIGKNAIITADLPKSMHGAFMTMFRGNANDFVFQLLATKAYYKQVYADLGARINSINSSQLKRYKFFVPNDESEQKKIAVFLGSVDDKVNKLHRKRKLLEIYRRGLIQKIFSQELRFKQDDGIGFPNWEEDRIDSFIQRVSNAVEVDPNTIYREIGIRSHGKGVFHKKPIVGKELGNKRVFWVEHNAFVLNIVFGWEQAVALTTVQEEGFIASHRFPMFTPRNNRVDLRFLLIYFLRKKGKYLLGVASPGGAGRNKTLGQNEFARLKVRFPKLEEQKKIADFLSTIDNKIDAISNQIQKTETFKKGLLQQMFV